MEKILAGYLWHSVLVRIDGMIVSFRTTEKHIRHLDEILTLLETSGIFLAIGKCHFAYPSVYYLNWLGVRALEEKIEIIKRLQFPTTLKVLESGL
jgi:hypothetical protein